jgi:thiol-disulfide isomerase/thioredoxin
MSSFPFISLSDRRFASLEKKAFSRFKESNPSTDTIMLSKFAKGQTINIFRSTYSIIDSIALQLSEEYRYFLLTYFKSFLQNVSSQRLGKDILSDISNYSSFLKSTLSNGQIIDWLIGMKIRSKIVTTGTTISETQFYKDLDLVFNKHLKDELEYYYKLFSSLQPGAIAPAVLVKDEKGQNKSLSAYTGKYIFIDFWSSDCLPCISDITNYSKPVADKYKGKDVVFLYISLDDNVNVWYKSLKKYSPAGVNLRATGGWNDKISKDYAIFAIPRYVIINPDGTIKDAQAEGLYSLLFSENPFQ